MRDAHLLELRRECPLDEENVREEQHHRHAPDHRHRGLEEPIGSLVVATAHPWVEDRDDEDRRQHGLRQDRVDRHLALIDAAELGGHPLLETRHEQQPGERVVVDDRVRDEEPDQDEPDDDRERMRAPEADLNRLQDVRRRPDALRRRQ